MAIAVNQTYLSNKGANALSRAATVTISLDKSDGSINKRLRYYSHVASHLLSNPIIGVGLKLEIKNQLSMIKKSYQAMWYPTMHIVILFN